MAQASRQEDQALEYLRSKLRDLPVIGDQVNRLTPDQDQNRRPETNERASYERARRSEQNREANGSFGPNIQQAIDRGDVRIPEGAPTQVGGAQIEAMGGSLAQEISSLLQKGSPFGRGLALIVALISDISDFGTTGLSTIGSPTILVPILSTVLSALIGVCSIASFLLLRQEFGILGYRFRKTLLRKFIIVTTCEIIPGIELLPLNTAMMLMLLRKIKGNKKSSTALLRELRQPNLSSENLQRIFTQFQNR